MTPAIKLLQKAKVSFRLCEYQYDPSSHSVAEEAAHALGVVPERVFKTLVCKISGGQTLFAVGIVPANQQLDVKALASCVGSKKASMADTQDAERVTGYVVGGISPLGQRRRLPTVVDRSALAHKTVYVSAGKRGFQIELAPGDLIQTCSAKTAALAR